LTRRIVLLALVGWTLVACRTEPMPEASEPPPGPLNIVVLYADDWRFDTLGCAGNPVVRTPNIDRLAAEGVRFRNSYVTSAICGVSRATMLTGQWMSRHGNLGFGMFRTPWAETFPAILRADGFRIGHVGKWHNGEFPSACYDFGEGRITPMRHWLERPDGSRTHVTRRNEDDALAFLRTKPPGRPFCLTVAFVAPHAEDGDPRQYLPQEESLGLYRDTPIPVPATATDEAFRALPPFLANDRNEGRRRWSLRFDTPERYQESMRNYLRLVTEVDAACGRVLEELQRQGDLDRTLVIFTTDNGYLHGEHGLADKWYPFEERIRVPLIVRDPRLPRERQGMTNDSPVLNADLAPTILAAAGLARPSGMQGRDLAPLYLGPEPADWRRDFLYEHPTIGSVDFIPSSKAVVEKDWKYVLWPDFGVEQLFDLSQDRGERRDLAGDPRHVGRLETMRTRLRELEAAAR
jgi:arylsulfatase A-like enzyme